ncbi:zinc finger protein 850-like [Eleutherodactylus coqui]|uniref:zinc finger protein 850-like n=1 Tax=Eleutherodactylus coqui TaxID=57060 RepID=UPI0034633EAB
MAENILNLTLEILFQLTGEDYTVVKKTSSDGCQAPVCDGWGRPLSPITASPPHPLLHENINVQKILELTNKMIELLTGEVPIRCQDVAVYFSMEEWEYLEGHKDLYKEAMMETHQSLPSPVPSSKRRTPERCPRPLLPQDHQLLYPDKDLTNINTTEANVWADQRCKEEIPTGNCPDDGSESSEVRLIFVDCKAEDVGTQDTYEEPAIIPDIPSALHSKDPSSDPLIQVPSYDSSQTDEQKKIRKRGEHQRAHTGEKPYSCTEYRKCFNQKLDLIREQRNHTGEKPYSCSVCGKCFIWKSHLDKHQIFHTGEKPFSCSECEKCFSLKSDLVKHFRIHTGERPFSCSECGKSFTLKPDVVKHFRIHTGEKPFSCSKCGKCFLDKSQLRAHQKAHSGEKPHCCSVCGKCFTRKSDLVKHQKIHTGEKPFSCSECGKCFTSKLDLVKHQRIHTGEKPFSCSECEKCFTLKSHLVRHQRTHTGEKPFSCTECGKCFADKSRVITHQKTHTGEKSFPCSECGKCFICKSHLVRHHSSHTGEKPFSCSECGKCFNRKSHLDRHQRIHTRENPYSCSVRSAGALSKKTAAMEDLVRQLVQICLQQQNAQAEARQMQQETNRLLMEQMATLREAVVLQRTAVTATQSTHPQGAQGGQPSARASVQAALQKMTAADDVEACLHVFERIAEREGLPIDQWADVVAPFLSGEAQKAYYDLSELDSRNYAKLRAEILARLGMTIQVRAGRVHVWRYSESLPTRSQMHDLIHLVSKWLQPEDCTPVQMVERIVLDIFHRSLPPAVQHWVGQAGTTDANHLMNLVERYCATEELLEASTRQGGDREAKGSREDAVLAGNTESPAEVPAMAELEVSLENFGSAQLKDPTLIRAREAVNKGKRGTSNSRSPLVPLPVIEVPFDRIAMDLVGPVVKSARGHQYILVILDYATWYPEAIPLRNTSSKLIAQELFQMFSRTGFSLFELLYGRHPRSLLDFAKETWKSECTPYKSVVEHISVMQDRIVAVMPIVKEHLDRHKWHRVESITEQESLAAVNAPSSQVFVKSMYKVPEVAISGSLSKMKKQEAKELVLQNTDVFSELPGCTSVIKHDIVMEPYVQVRMKPYRIPEAHRQAIAEEVKKMLDLGVIEVSKSEWSSPIVLIPKPDGTLRFCNDFRKLNEVYKLDSYPMPRVDELIESLEHARFFSTLDLTKGYWQVPHTDEAKEKTAFSTPEGLFQYVCLPFGLHGAPATFQRMMDIILRPHRRYASAYLDHIIIFSNDWESHLAKVQAVVNSLRDAGLTANPKKCTLGVEEARYLGYVIGRGVIKPQINKVEAIQNWPQPLTKEQVRVFLGIVGYYCRFIPSFATIAAPLTELTKGRSSTMIKWNDEAEQAFRKLKTALCREPVLITTDFSKTFVVQTVASDVGVGAVVSQAVRGEEHPATYLSRKLTPAERNYSIVERECLAIKWSLESLRIILVDQCRREKARNKMAENILNLTLEILFQLTGEVRDSDDVTLHHSWPIICQEPWKAEFPQRLSGQTHKPAPLKEQFNLQKFSEMVPEVPTRTDPSGAILMDANKHYTVVKKTSSDGCREPVCDGWGRPLDPITLPPPYSLIHEDINVQKILKLTNKMIELLTEEVPIRCQDVTVYFSMEEWEYLEGHKDLYKEAMMETCQLLPSPDDGSESSEVRLIFEDCKAEDFGTQDTYEEPAIIPDIPSALHSKDTSSGLLIQVPSYYSSQTDEQKKSRKRGEHQRAHTGEKSYSCTEYRKCFNQKLDLIREQRNHTGEKPYSCSVCGKCFIWKSHLDKHQIFHTGEKPFSCSECEKCFSLKSDLVKHFRIHTGERPFSCSECGKSFTLKPDLVKHFRIHTGEKPFSCSKCGKCFLDKSQLKTHQRAHSGEKPHCCSECGKCFTQKSDLVKHQKIHTGEKPFSCSECGKCFISKLDLVKHQRIHTGEKPFSCSECEKCFTLKSYLVRHQRTHTGEKPFSCTECGKCFADKSRVITHQKTHTGEKSFSCSECGKCFICKSDLVRHHSSHTGEKPFSCSECGKCFNRKSHLDRHQRIHTRENPYSCSVR